MGGELVTGSSSPEGDGFQRDAVPHLSHTEQFYQQLPFYLAIGMTWDQYWNEDCTLTRYYREAYELRRKERNHDLWLQGLYFYHALCDASPLFRFSTKPQKATPYIEEPFPLTQEDMEVKKEREERQRYEKIKAKTEAWMVRNRPKEVKSDVPG